MARRFYASVTRAVLKVLNLKVKQKCKYSVTTDSKHWLLVAENALNQQFSPQAPNQAWATDITHLWAQQGWVYLIVVIDLYSRRVVSYAMDYVKGLCNVPVFC